MNELIEKLMKFLAQESKENKDKDIEGTGEPNGEGKSEVDKSTKSDEKADKKDSQKEQKEDKKEEVKEGDDKVKVEDFNKLVSLIEGLTSKVEALEVLKKEDKQKEDKQDSKDDKGSSEGFNPAPENNETVNTLADAIALARNGQAE